MDINTLAKSITDKATGETPEPKPLTKAATRGLARAAALTPERRTEIAKGAAKKRWEGKIEAGE